MGEQEAPRMRFIQTIKSLTPREYDDDGKLKHRKQSPLHKRRVSPTTTSKPNHSAEVPSDWQVLVQMLPAGVREDWEGDAPVQDPALFRLVTTLYAEGLKDSQKYQACGVISPEGIEWFEDRDAAMSAYQKQLSSHDGLAFLACMPGYKSDVYIRGAFQLVLSVEASQYDVDPATTLFDRHDSSGGDVEDDGAVFDTGCQKTCLSAHLFTPALRRSLPRSPVHAATGLVTAAFVPGEFHIAIGDSHDWLTPITVNDPCVTQESLIGMDIISQFRWRLGQAGSGLYGVEGVEANEEFHASPVSTELFSAEVVSADPDPEPELEVVPVEPPPRADVVPTAIDVSVTVMTVVLVVGVPKVVTVETKGVVEVDLAGIVVSVEVKAEV
ncbi:hypothetical protein HK097_008370 [Rhizophlyctis rosea]|uniref:Uncharacterized protein n=1 Tax=Rhizophlyctis rosea TaxID=64517 RepID=A0AAD5SIB4_9FUNG|nr:hypothetical protein HK097_008370 [Rhizophlyctis rosea]